MFSVIVCSIDPERFAAVKAVYTAAMGDEPWELIGIHDAKSLAEGYTRGIADSRGELLIFSHDDIEILSQDVPRRLKSHLSQFDLVGVAGTTQLVSAIWYSNGPPHLVGQVAHKNKDGSLALNIYATPRPLVGGMQAMDGLFLACRRSVFDTVSFDAQTFDGFHLYDLDFTYAAFKAGLKLAVACDIHVLHNSLGSYHDEKWKHYADLFGKKWLPGITQPPRRFAIGAISLYSKAHAIELMTPPYWEKPDAP